mgnify:CR=1 FL=1
MLHFKLSVRLVNAPSYCFCSLSQSRTPPAFGFARFFFIQEVGFKTAQLIVVIHVTALTGLCFQIVLVFRFVMCGWFRFLDIVEGERVGFPLRSCGLSRCFDRGRVKALVSRYVTS